MKVFVLINLLFVDIYNLKPAKGNIFRIKNSPFILGVGLILALFIFYLCFNYSKDLLGFLIGLSDVILFFTFTLGQGIREDGFVLFLGNTPLLKLVSFTEIESMALFDGKNSDLILEIKAHSTT